MARELVDRGIGEAYALRGGFDAWKEAGLPVEAKDVAGAARP